MPTLDIREVAVRGLNVQLNFSSIDPLDSGMINRLRLSYLLARDVLNAAVNGVQDLRGCVDARKSNGKHNPATPCTGPENKFAVDTIYTHFKLDIESRYDLDKTLDHLGKIHSRYLKIQHGLEQRVVLADSRSEDVRKTLMKYLTDNNQPIPEKKKAHEVIQALPQSTKDQMAQSLSLQRSSDEGVGEGYVSAKSRVVNRLGLEQTQTTPLEPHQQGGIHLNFAFLRDDGPLGSLLYIACLIIHEASHKFASTFDHNYTWETFSYSALATEQKIENADSYAYAAISLYKRHVFAGKSDFESLTDAVNLGPNGG